MGRKTIVNEENQEQFLSDYAELKTVKALANKWGMNEATASKSLQRLGVDASRRPDIFKNDYHPKLGVWTDNRVAKDLGVSRQAVAKARRRRGLESPYERAMRLMNEG